MTARELRQKYLQFFESKGHTIFPSGSLVPIDVTGKLDESLLFNGAGMVQFKPYFRGAAQPPNKRLTTAQKCVRTGDIETVGDLSHLTFFEMMGNFSFGDYFKKDAIAYSWEFLTSPNWLGIDPKRLSFTVFEEDDVAYNNWVELLTEAGIDASKRVFRLGEETNYWPAGAFSNGPPGPCGPNSEMFYWVSNDVPPPVGDYSTEDWLRDDAEGNWLEIWNDVFIQYEWKGQFRNPDRPSDGYHKQGMDDLPFQSIDTGMGLERTIAVLNGSKSVYESDLFTPILAKIGEMCATSCEGDESKERATRIIADHIRTACFCIADGILPSNNGRGYVLRRLIRRAVLKGQRVLGFNEPFFHRVYEGVVEAMGDHYHELEERRDVITETLLNEESLFRRTLAAGSTMLMDELELLKRTGSNTKVLGGATAFRLYDTYGFPLEVTRELCEEAGVEVDEEGYDLALAKAQELSRGSSGMDTVYGGLGEEIIVAASPKAQPQTLFVGYVHSEVETEIVQVSPRFGPDGKTTGEFQVSLLATPFYAESGGQVGDTGWIHSIGREDFNLEVFNTWKEMGLYWCDTKTESPALVGLTAAEVSDLLQSGFFFQPVIASIDVKRRRKIVRNHTATHLLHGALRHVLGKHVTQAGSLVSPDHLRFDFTHGKAMTDEERREVERLVNDAALSGSPVNIFDNVPISEAKKAGAMALFGEKYGDVVRMVEIPGLSLELCGGCHVNNTAEIGLFVLAHEASAASGVRRIEALTGEAAFNHVRDQAHKLEKAASLLKSTPGELVHAVEKTLDALRDERRKREKAESALVSGKAGKGDAPTYEQVGSVLLWTPKYDGVDPKIAATAIDEAVASNPNLVALAGIVADGKISFVCKVGSEALKAGAHAGNLVKEAAKVAGGGGGGRPDFATAGGKDASKVDAALATAKSVLG